jgi:hypothetical protein
MSAPPIIVWDVDDVLNRLMFFWLGYWNEINNTDVSYSDVFQNPPHSILGISREDYFDSLDGFRNSESGKNVLENDIVKNWFENHGNRFSHVACTARPIETMPNQSRWVYHNYGNWIHTVHAASSRRYDNQNDHTITKVEFITWIKRPVLFIDDSEENIRSVSGTGVDTMLYPQPWNNADISEHEFMEDLNSRLRV